MLLYKETRKPEPFAQNANAVGSWIGSRHRENGVVAGEMGSGRGPEARESLLFSFSYFHVFFVSPTLRP